MKAVVIGPGRIGCGFAGHVLRESGYDVVFLARNPVMVKHLNRVRRYRLLLSDSHRTEDILVQGVRAVGVFAPARAAREIAEADVIVTAVGANNLPNVAPLIAAGLRGRTTPVNVLAVENMRHASRRLRELVMEHWTEPTGVEHGFSGGLVERVVAKRLGEPEADQPLVFLGDNATAFRVDGARLVPPLPALKGMILSDQYEAWMKRKLYTYSAGHATAAYLGSLKGYHYIHTAIRDREIRAAVLAAMAEGQRGLLARYGPEISGDKRDLLEIISRFENATFGDRIQRVGRDPKRKLGVDERLVGAAQLAQRAGIPPRNLSLAAAAALCFVDPDDPSAAELGREIEQEGPGKAIQRVCGLRPDLPLGKLVHEDCNRLLTGRNGGGLLLHLGSDMWSCGDHVHATWSGNGKDGGAQHPVNGKKDEGAQPVNGKRRDDHAELVVNGEDGHVARNGNGKVLHLGLVPARHHGPPSTRPRPRAGGGLRLFFMLVRRVPPVASPVLVEVFDLLRQRGFKVDSGIAEEMVQRPDEPAVEHDLFILKSHTELSLSLAGALHSQGARLLNPYPSCIAVQNKIVASRLLRAAGIPAPDCWATGDLSLLREVVAERPLIIKPYLGHRGQGLRIVRDAEELSSVPPPETPVLVQEFIEGSAEDLKLYIVGEEVFAVRKPFSPTSFTQSGRPSEVDPEIKEIALRCGQALGLGLYGMDLVESKGRVWVVDVNTFPGYKGVPNVAPRIAEYIQDYALGRVALGAPVRRHPRRAETSRIPSTETHPERAAEGRFHGA